MESPSQASVMETSLPSCHSNVIILSALIALSRDAPIHGEPPCRKEDGPSPTRLDALRDEGAKAKHLHVCICSYIYTHMYVVFVYVCMYAWMYVCMYVCMYICMYVCMYVCMYSFMCMYTSVHACMHACVYSCVHVLVFACVYVHVYMHTLVSIANASVPTATSPNIYIYIYIESICINKT